MKHYHYVVLGPDERVGEGIQHADEDFNPCRAVQDSQKSMGSPYVVLLYWQEMSAIQAAAYAVSLQERPGPMRKRAAKQEE